MIKRLIGIVIAVAVIVIIVVTAFQRDTFRSMLLQDELMNQTLPQSDLVLDPATAVAPAATEMQRDTVTIEVADTLKQPVRMKD
ncbi:MAG: hypothetical protein RSB23_02900 [Alistipes sp.]